MRNPSLQLVLIVVLLGLLSAALLPAPTHGAESSSFPQQLELRRCQAIASPDEAQETVNCACKVTEWIRDGEGWIAVCAK